MTTKKSSKPLSAQTSLNQPARQGRSIKENLKISSKMVSTATDSDNVISGGTR